MKFTKVILAAMLICTASTAAANAAEIVPYTAKYTLSLKDLNIEGRSGKANGFMDVRVSRDCFHWWVDRELKFSILYTDGRKTDLASSERYRETLSGKRYWFWTRTTLNGRTVSITAGKARRPEEGEMVDVEEPKPEPKDENSATTVQANTAGAKEAIKTPIPTGAASAAEDGKKPGKAGEKSKRAAGVRVEYTWPNITEIELGPEVIFPVAALRQQLDALAAGALLRQQSVLSGTRESGAERVAYSMVSPAAITIAALPDGDAGLLDSKSWRFKAVYFPLEGDKSAKPTTTVIQKVHANGIISEMLFDLGLFSIEGKVNWIKELPIPSCE